MPTDGLFARPRLPKGPHERGLETTLRAWRKLDHMTGDDHAAARAVLRELARRADSAAHRQTTGDISEYSAAMVAREFRAALDDYAPPYVDQVDRELEALATAAQAAMTDAAEL